MLTFLRQKAVIVSALVLLALAPAVALPVAVGAADIEGNVSCGSVDLDLSGSGGCEGQLQGGTTKVNDIITDAINIFSIIVGIVAVIMIIVGGFKYITSGGDSGNITSAKNTIIYAVIGLVVVALAQFLVQFVLDKAVN